MITFLFTDIEGSTKLWESYPGQMSVALTRHDEILREAIERNQGHVFKTVGDAFCAAFPAAPEALEACLEAQLDLAQEPWPEPVKIKVRMAVHSGEAETRNGDYFGQSLNRVARLLSSAHGGQSLVSVAARAEIADRLPLEASLSALGEHRLKDLGRPEAIFQLLHPELHAEFPPLRSLDSVPNNLPQQLTSFVGRESELAEIKALIERTRLLTIVGPGGAGKTRLSLQIAAEMLVGSLDGVWFVDLAPLTDHDLVVPTVAGILGLREGSARIDLDTLTGYMKDKPLVLILDNCEHLLQTCAVLADGILRKCPRVLILASSREALGTAGELTYRAPPLSHPRPVRSATPQSISHYEAVELFIERAQFHSPSFALTNANAPALASICHRLDGIPLAIELSAARVRSLTVEDIDRRLNQRFKLLTGGSRTALPRQQTLRSLMDWSYELLNDPEKRLLCRLSVFTGGWTLSAAEQLGSGEPDTASVVENWEVLDLLQGLVDKSLVIAETNGDAARYRLLETVRHYALDRLAESGESEAVRKRHRDYFVNVAREAELELRGVQQARYHAMLETEHDNLRAALAFSRDDSDGVPGLKLGRSLWLFWANAGHMHEGREHLREVLTHPANVPPSDLRIDVLNGLATLAFLQSDFTQATAIYEQGLELGNALAYKAGVAAAFNGLGNVAVELTEYERAKTRYNESLALQRELGSTLGLTAALVNLGRIAYLTGDYEASKSLQEECLGIYRAAGDRHGIGKSLYHLGIVAFYQGDHPLALELGSESLAIRRELANTQGVADCLTLVATVTGEMGDYAAARPLHEEGLALQRELGNRTGVGTALINLGTLTRYAGDGGSARSHFIEALQIMRDLGDKRGVIESFEGIASIASLDGRNEFAARLWGVASAMREAAGLTSSPSEFQALEADWARAKGALGTEDFVAAWEVGNALPLDKAIDLALAAESA